MREFERLRRLSRELLVLSSAGDTIRHAPGVVDRLLAALDERHVPAGGAVYEAGAPPESIFFMRAGEIAFEWPGGPSYTLADRWVFGALDVIAARPYRVRAIARTDVDLVTIDGARWLEIIEDSPELAQRFLARTAADAARLHERLGPAGGFAAPRRASETPPLPPRPLLLMERAVALAAVPTFAGASAHAQVGLAQVAEEIVVSAGQRLFERNDRLHAVVEGEVEAPHEWLAARFGPGQLVGGAALALAEARPDWEARALAPSRLLTVAIADFFAEMEEHFDVFRS